MELARTTYYVACAQEVTMPVEIVPTPSAPRPAGPYAPAVRAGDWLVLAGQVGLDPATGRIVDGGVDARARQVLANGAAILAGCGAAWSGAAKTTTFVTDIGVCDAADTVYAEVFGHHR